MGYELHITRRSDWSDGDGPEIRKEEWLAIVESDNEMVLDENITATTTDGNATIGYYSQGMAAWTGYSRELKDGGRAWFNYGAGNVAVKGPDQEIRVKMHQIAKALQARVQGDEGEFYNAAGNPIADETQTRKTWWKLW